jgi:hypothetical protein
MNFRKILCVCLEKRKFQLKVTLYYRLNKSFHCTRNEILLHCKSVCCIDLNKGAPQNLLEGFR